MSENVAAVPATDNVGVADIIAWIEKMRDRGVVPASTAANWVSALNAFKTIVQADEPQTARFILDRLDDIAQRWAIKNSAKSETTNTYRARVKTALGEYFRYLEDATSYSFKPKLSTTSSGDDAAPRRASSKSTAPRDRAPEPTPPPAVQLREYPLGKDRQPFRYELPSDLVLADVERIAYHLATMATDFDPRTNFKLGSGS